MTFVEILQDLGISYVEGGTHKHVTTGWKGLDCPRCSPNSNKFKLGYKDGFWLTCWTCGTLSLKDALSEITGLPHFEIVSRIHNLDQFDVIQHQPKRGSMALPKGVGPLLPAHINYLKQRGFDPDELVRLWDVQGIGLSNRLPWRIFIPVKNEGKTVSWTTRSISDQITHRYFTAKPHEESMSIKSVLYGESYLRHVAIIVEGPTDVWRIGPGAVATMGLSYSKTQLLKISRYPLRVIIFDSENKAQKRARKLAADLSSFPGKTVVIRLNAADPGSACPEEIHRLRKTFLE